MFVIHRKQNSTMAIPLTFLFTGLMGGALGPIVAAYLAVGAGYIVFQALSGTAIIFLTLSAYALISKRDFSYLGGFLMIGLIVALVAIIANILLAIPALSLAISAAIILIMSGFILYDTGNIIHGGETNYVMATVSLYLNIYNLFVNLLSILYAIDD